MRMETGETLHSLNLLVNSFGKPFAFEIRNNGSNTLKNEFISSLKISGDFFGEKDIADLEKHFIGASKTDISKKAENLCNGIKKIVFVNTGVFFLQ